MIDAEPTDDRPEELMIAFRTGQKALNEAGGISPMFSLYKNNRPQVMVAVNGAGLQIATVARLLIPAFDADAVVHVSDTYVAHNPINPSTGSQWGPGEMQMYFEMGNAEQVIVEALMATLYRRDYTVCSATQHYVRHEDHLTFAEPIVTAGRLGDYDHRGRVEDGIVDGFENRVHTEELYTECSDTPRETVDLFLREMTVRTLLDAQLITVAMTSKDIALAVAMDTEDTAEHREVIKSIHRDFALPDPPAYS